MPTGMLPLSLLRIIAIGRVSAWVLAMLSLATAASAQPTLTLTEFPVDRGFRPVIVKGPDGALWYNEFDRIGRITTDGVVSIFPLPDDGQVYPNGRGLEGLTSGPDGALWFTESANGRIGRISTAGVVTEFQLEPDRKPFGITTGPDGALWFTNLGDSRVWRVTTTGAFTRFRRHVRVRASVGGGSGFGPTCAAASSFDHNRP